MAKCWNPRLVSGFLLTLNAHTSLLISPSPQIALPTRLIYLYSLSCSWSANDPHSTVKEKNKKIYSLQISFYELTSQLLWKSCQFPYNLLFSSASRLRFCWRFQGWDALCVKVMALEWQLLLPMTLIREPLSWEVPWEVPRPIPTSWTHLSNCQPQGLSPWKQQRRTGSPSRRDLSISEGGKSRLEQEAARCLFIYQPGWASPGRARGGDITEVLQRCFLLQGKPRTLKCFFLAHCEEEGLPR